MHTHTYIHGSCVAKYSYYIIVMISKFKNFATLHQFQRSLSTV